MNKNYIEVDIKVPLWWKFCG